MNEDVEDIFKSFVSSKLKQLGMSGHTSKDLEKSLQKSALGKLDEKMEVDSSKENFHSDSDFSTAKAKKVKKSKKHKKEKKTKKEKDKKHDKELKKADKHSKKYDKDSKKIEVSFKYLEKDLKKTESCSKKHDKDFTKVENHSKNHDKHSKKIDNHCENNISKTNFKDKILQAEPDDVIKTKSSTSYYETVKKMEKIEKLSLKSVNVEDENVQIKEYLNIASCTKEKKSSPESSPKNPMSPKKSVSPKESGSPDPKPIPTDDIETAVKNVVVSDKPEVDSQPTETKDKTIDSGSSNSVTGLPSNSSNTESKPTTVMDSTAVVTKENDTSVKNEKETTETPKETSKSPKRRKHSRSHRSRSRSPKHRKHSRNHRSRSRSPSRKRSKHSHNRHRSRSPRHKHRHHHRHKSSDRKHRSSRHRRSPTPVITSRDKMKLLEIAKANVLAQHQAGITASSLSAESKAMLRSGGVTLAQLTDVCKDISDGRREVLANVAAAAAAAEKPSKIHHPFQMREAPSISIHIKNALPPIPAKPVSELTKEFPVSSGSQHQRKEVLEEVYGKWEPIVKDQETKSSMQAILEEKVFPDAPVDNTLSIKDVIAQRVSAVRELESNPTNAKAVKNMLESQNKIDNWTASQIVPGRFTGSTGLQPIPRRELEKGQQAWVNQKTLNSGKVVGGIGKSLLQKMGWREGESLGKNNFGMVEPIKVQIKTDRKGLSSFMEMPASNASFPASLKRPPVGGETNHVVLKDLSGKHPVSAIMEICSKRRWKAPDFVLVQQPGPAHHSSFIFKVMVNDVYYQPAVPSVNKKQAKAQAASAALQALGLIPS